MSILIKKIWYWWEQKENKNSKIDAEELFKLYNTLWEKADLYATTNLEGDKLKYFYKELD